MFFKKLHICIKNTSETQPNVIFFAHLGFKLSPVLIIRAGGSPSWSQVAITAVWCREQEVWGWFSILGNLSTLQRLQADFLWKAEAESLTLEKNK